MTVQNPIRVLIVDDHAMLRKGLTLFLMSYPDLKLVGQAANGEEALARCAENPPDVVLMDLVMPIMDGIATTYFIRHNYPTIQVIALTNFGEEMLIRKVLEAGASCYLCKKVAADELARAIRSAHTGTSTLATESAKTPTQSMRQTDRSSKKLTTRELEMLTLRADKLHNNEIASN